MKALHEKLKRIALAVVLTLLTVFSFLLPAVKTASAAETETVYSEVVDDLIKNGNFDTSLYPNDPLDMSMQLIQVAESSDKELFLYVYQPSDSVKELVATSVNLSATTDDTLDSHLYSLTLVSTVGVFDKYVVDDLVVPDSVVRYYKISSILRPWDASIDPALDNDNTISEVSYDIGKKFTAFNIGEDVFYSCEDFETIRVTGKYVGFLRYYDERKRPNGFYDDLDSFFVGFSTERKVENLLSAKITAEIYTVTEKWHYYASVAVGQGSSISEPKEQEFTVVRGEEDDFKTSAWFYDETYVWDQIQTKEEFYSQDGADFSNVLKAESVNIDWVLRFYNAPIKVDEDIFLGFGKKTITTFHVSDVSILELTFKSDGEIFVVGVVDNVQTGGNKPAGVFNKPDDDWWLSLIVGLLLLAILSPIMIPLIELVAKLLAKLLSLVWAIICLPFKLLGKLFKKKPSS